MEEGVSPNGSSLAAVVHQRKIPFCRSVKLPDLNVSKPAREVPPNIRPDPVSYRNLYFVVSITEFLLRKKCIYLFIYVALNVKLPLMLLLCRTYLWCVAEVTHNFTYVLYDSDVILSAVIPELRCRKFIP